MKTKNARLIKNRTKFIEHMKKQLPDVTFPFIEDEYVNATSKITIRCPIHGDWISTPGSVKVAKFNCKQCKDLGKFTKKWEQDKIQFIKDGSEKFNNKFDYSKFEYKGVAVKGTIICPEHGEFQQPPNNHLESSYGCALCAPNASLNKDDFVNKAKAKFNNKFDYSSFKYVSIDTKGTIICPEHGEFEQTPYQHTHSIYGCPRCSGNVKYSTEEIISKYSKKFPELDFSETKYINSSEEIEINCPKHGKFKAFIYNLNKSDYPCSKCRYERISESLRLSQNEILKRFRNVHGDRYDYSKVKYTNINANVTIICTKHGEFKQRPESHILGANCPKCGNAISKPEQEIVNILSESNIDIIQNDRNLIKPLEIDILIPEHNVAIEYNGMSFHSIGTNFPNNVLTLDKKYHKNKTDLVENKGYQLFHIFENEWLNSVKKRIWISLLRNKLKLIPKDNTIFARKCHIHVVSNAESKEFQSENHLQGYRSSRINLGLYYQNELVSLMTFSKPGFSKGYEYELIRFCSKINHRVIGGASKLLKYFERNYNPTSIVTYANRRWSQGNLYNALGFEFKHFSDPNYFYIHISDNYQQMYSRNNFQKHMLKDKLEKFDADLTEQDNMYNNDYRRIFDSGNIVFEKIYK